MSACMLTATIVLPADREGLPDFDAGRAVVDTITDSDLYDFGDIETEIDALLPGLDPDVVVFDDAHRPDPQYLQAAGRAIIDNLEEALSSQEVSTLHIAGYMVCISGGMSWGDAPSDAAQAIWDANELPVTVLEAMGFVPDPSQSASAAQNRNASSEEDRDV